MCYIESPLYQWAMLRNNLRTSHVTCHASHVTRHTSPRCSHVTHRVTRHTSRHTSRVTQWLSRHTSHITRHTSPVTCHSSNVKRRDCCSGVSASAAAGTGEQETAGVQAAYGHWRRHADGRTSHVALYTSHVTRASYDMHHASHITSHTPPA